MSDVKIRIIVCDRGFVYVCRCQPPIEVALWLPATDSRTIRRWGTTNGLGELVHGPTSNTVLDAIIPSKTIPVRAILDVLEVDQAAWESHLIGGRR